MHIKQFFAQVKLLPKAFYKIFVESKTSWALKKQIGRQLTRKENELVRSNSLQFRKGVVFFVVQLVPVIGYIPIFVALLYPRIFLSEPFWDETQHQLFLKEEYDERTASSILLSSSFKKMKSVYNYELKKEIDSDSDNNTLQDNNKKVKDNINLSQILEKVNIDFSMLPSSHLILLAQSNSLSALGNRIYSLLPSSILQNLLSKRATEINQDDILLRQEGVEDLCSLELQIACVRRSINPQNNIEDLRHLLKQWLVISQRIHEHKTNVIENNKDKDIMINNYNNNDKNSQNVLLHAIAFSHSLIPSPNEHKKIE